MDQICKLELCVGCMACVNVCPRNAISMVRSDMTHLIPMVDSDKCIDCGLCQKSCPNLANVKMLYPVNAYVGYASDINEQTKSTSGGIASAIIRSVIAQGGVAYGCSSKNYRDIRHIRIDNEKDIDLIRGSKYVHSVIGNVYQQIKQDLNTKKVVFVGTPCQVAGLLAFLKGKTENLLTIDFACHGVPSQQILRDAISITGYGDLTVEVAFRRKPHGKKSKYGLFLYAKNGDMIFSQTFPKNLYLTGFIEGLFYRESCYNCKFASINRCSDITLGDYSEKLRQTCFPKQKEHGLSTLLVNTTKGLQYIKSLNDKLVLEQTTPEFYYRTNMMFQGPMKKHKFYDKFAQLYKSRGYKYAVDNTLKDDVKRYLKINYINFIRDILYHIPFMEDLYKLLRKAI